MRSWLCKKLAPDGGAVLFRFTFPTNGCEYLYVVDAASDNHTGDGKVIRKKINHLYYQFVQWRSNSFIYGRKVIEFDKPYFLLQRHFGDKVCWISRQEGNWTEYPRVANTESALHLDGKPTFEIVHACIALSSSVSEVMRVRICRVRQLSTPWTSSVQKGTCLKLYWSDINQKAALIRLKATYILPCL